MAVDESNGVPLPDVAVLAPATRIVNRLSFADRAVIGNLMPLDKATVAEAELPARIPEDPTAKIRVSLLWFQELPTALNEFAGEDVRTSELFSDVKPGSATRIWSLAAKSTL